MTNAELHLNPTTAAQIEALKKRTGLSAERIVEVALEHLNRVLTFDEEQMARDMYERRLAIREAEEERWRRNMDDGAP
ncbi:MAG: hypothetical protein WEA29_01490 [Acidimicrobiia bacterium]